jgi:hypothetical protein
MVRLQQRCATAMCPGVASPWRASTENCCITAAIKDTLDRKGLLKQLQVCNSLQHAVSCMPPWSRPAPELHCSTERFCCVCFHLQLVHGICIRLRRSWMQCKWFLHACRGTCGHRCTRSC